MARNHIGKHSHLKTSKLCPSTNIDIYSSDDEDPDQENVKVDYYEIKTSTFGNRSESEDGSEESEEDEESEESEEDDESEEDEESEEDSEEDSEEEEVSSEGEEDVTKKVKIKKKRHVKNNELLGELIANQLDDISANWKLTMADMRRICQYVPTTIFGDECCIWQGYITNLNNPNKGPYVNFYFKSKKVALHRLLYSNFVAALNSTEYLKFNCENKGICCNVNHYDCYKYSKVNKVPTNKITKKNRKNKGNEQNGKNILTLDFD